MRFNGGDLLVPVFYLERMHPTFADAQHRGYDGFWDSRKWRPLPRILKQDPGTARQGLLEMNQSGISKGKAQAKLKPGRRSTIPKSGGRDNAKSFCCR